MSSSSTSMLRARWAAIGAVLAICLGAGSIGVANAVKSSGERPVYTAIPACRVTDTRPAPDLNVGPKNTPLGSGKTMTVKVTGNNGDCSGIPNDITGVSLNVTALHATLDTHLTIWDEGSVPDASSLNPSPGQPPVPNAVTTKVAADGTFKVFNFQGSVNVIIDIVGYHQDHNHDDRYAPKEAADDIWGYVRSGGDVLASTGNFEVIKASTGFYCIVLPARNSVNAAQATAAEPSLSRVASVLTGHATVCDAYATAGKSVLPIKLRDTATGDLVNSAFTFFVPAP